MPIDIHRSNETQRVAALRDAVAQRNRDYLFVCFALVEGGNSWDATDGEFDDGDGVADTAQEADSRDGGDGGHATSDSDYIDQ